MFYELTKLPVRRGGFVEFEYAAWPTSIDKARMTAIGYKPSPTDMVLADEQSRVLPCMVANNHRMQIQETGSRIVINGGGKMRLLDGSWVSPLQMQNESDRSRAEAIGFAKETFAVDTSAAIAAAIQGFMQRETMRQQVAWRDPKGKLPWQRDARGTTLNLQVSESAGDAEEGDSGSGFSSTGSWWTCVSDSLAGGRYNGGCRFVIAIPKDATIAACTSQIWPHFGTSLADMNAQLGFQAVDNASNFSTDADVTTRTTSMTSKVSWVADQVGAGSWATSPSLVTPMQEIVNRAGWASGNAAVLLFDANTDIRKGGYFTAYDGDTSKAAKLDIDYTAGGGGGMSFGSGGLAFRSGRIFGGKALR